jgi:Domain of unknown function (DUF4224)
MTDEIVSQDQLCELTGVGKKATGRAVKIATVLTKAGIVHWYRHDGTIATTWHHVKNANPNPKIESPSNMPRFRSVR